MNEKLTEPTKLLKTVFFMIILPSVKFNFLQVALVNLYKAYFGNYTRMQVEGKEGGFLFIFLHCI